MESHIFPATNTFIHKWNEPLRPAAEYHTNVVLYEPECLNNVLVQFTPLALLLAADRGDRDTVVPRTFPSRTFPRTQTINLTLTLTLILILTLILLTLA